MKCDLTPKNKRFGPNPWKRFSHFWMDKDSYQYKPDFLCNLPCNPFNTMYYLTAWGLFYYVGYLGLNSVYRDHLQMTMKVK